MSICPCLGSAAQLDVLDIVEAYGDILELEQFKGGQYLVEDSGTGTITVCVVIGDTLLVATLEPLELLR